MMIKDEFGICLSQDMLMDNRHSTFTHVRAYEIITISNDISDNSHVMLSYPQMTGEDVLSYQQENKRLVWRADYYCPSFK